MVIMLWWQLFAPSGELSSQEEIVVGIEVVRTSESTTSSGVPAAGDSGGGHGVRSGLGFSRDGRHCSGSVPE
jgi:hypothetical protein